MYNFHGMHWGMGWGFMGFGWIFGIALVIIVVWAITRSANSSPLKPEKQNIALEILKKRFANGEINQEEYEEKKRVLLQ